MKQEKLLEQIRTILNDLPFREQDYLCRQTAFDVCVKTAEWLQEQMMKDAIDATIDIIYTPTTWLPDIVYDRYKLKDLCKDRFEQDDEVKVIIIKD